jgi:hypothetical protein
MKDFPVRIFICLVVSKACDTNLMCKRAVRRNEFRSGACLVCVARKAMRSMLRGLLSKIFWGAYTFLKDIGQLAMCLVRHFKPFTLFTHVRSKSASKLPMDSVLPASILRSFSTHTHSISISSCVQMRPSILLCALSGSQNQEHRGLCSFAVCKLVHQDRYDLRLREGI